DVCSNGIPGIQSGRACCLAECGACGGPGCGQLGGGLGEDSCCQSEIEDGGELCAGRSRESLAVAAAAAHVFQPRKLAPKKGHDCPRHPHTRQLMACALTASPASSPGTLAAWRSAVLAAGSAVPYLAGDSGQRTVASPRSRMGESCARWLSRPLAWWTRTACAATVSPASSPDTLAAWPSAVLAAGPAVQCTAGASAQRTVASPRSRMAASCARWLSRPLAWWTARTTCAAMASPASSPGTLAAWPSAVPAAGPAVPCSARASAQRTVASPRSRMRASCAR
ncbi:unnamed protein product, partial [Hapterophycus canaliculatus]